MKLTYCDVCSINPLNPAKGEWIPKDWSGTFEDLISIPGVWPHALNWLLTSGKMDEKTLRLFGVWSVRCELIDSGVDDPRSYKACSVARRLALGDIHTWFVDDATARADEAYRSYQAQCGQSWKSFAAGAAVVVLDSNSANAASAAQPMLWQQYYFTERKHGQRLWNHLQFAASLLKLAESGAALENLISE